MVVHVGSEAQPTVNGMPISTDTVEDLIAGGAKVREVRDDDPIAPARGDAIPTRLRQYLIGRDSTCRVPGCGRAFGLEAHHIVPKCWGGRTDKHNLVLVCTTHHHRLVPHGPWVLEGDPERPDGLRWDRLGVDRYEVRVREGVVGYIDVVGAVFVALAGARYDRAVEVLQTLDFDAAVRAVSSAKA